MKQVGILLRGVKSYHNERWLVSSGKVEQGTMMIIIASHVAWTVCAI